MIVDVEKVAELIAEIADEHIMARYGRLNAEEIREKAGPHDLVTDVDELVEEALENALRGVHPGAGFIGEELAAKDPEAANVLTGEGAFWIVDPIDGTRNFVRGVDEFGVIVAYAENGETRAGWIYAAPEAACAIGEKGEGATWRGERIGRRQSQRETLVGLRSLGNLPRERQARMRQVLKENFDSRPNQCAAYAYISILRGDTDFKISSLIHAWDHAAGALMVTESGGEAAFLDTGERYHPMGSVAEPLLVTGLSRDWRAIAEKLRR